MTESAEIIPEDPIAEPYEAFPRHPVAQAQWDEELATIRNGPPSIIEMMEVLDEESFRLATTQMARIDGAFILTPNKTAIRHEFVMRQAIGLLQKLHDHADKIRPILYPTSRGRKK
jgi:hypothetical protein